MADRDSVFPGNQIQDDSINQDELNITNIPTDGQILKINMPTGDFTAMDQPSGTNAFTQSFTNATLSSGILTVTHNLNVQYTNFIIYDDTDKKIMPDDATATNTTVLTIDLTSFGTLTGTWHVVVIG